MSILDNLRATGFHFAKSLGQNFITDEGFLASLVSELRLDGKTVVEVGTGAGTLTRAIANHAARVITFEIDKRLSGTLESQFTKHKNIDLVFTDALKVPDAEIIARAGESFELAANIPYYITSPLIMKFLQIPQCKSIAILVQDDVAKRITAAAGGKDYGALTVTMQAYCDCKILKAVPRKLFTPIPNVDSAFIVCRKKETPDIHDTPTFNNIVKGLFGARRKTIANGLQIVLGRDRLYTEDLLETLQIIPTARPETLSPQTFIALANLIYDKKSQ
jgi:16S rRNA (adenine1518-N6/adenine1519-N6)-dimethyltransferase